MKTFWLILKSFRFIMKSFQFIVKIVRFLVKYPVTAIDKVCNNVIILSSPDFQSILEILLPSYGILLKIS